MSNPKMSHHETCGICHTAGCKHTLAKLTDTLDGADGRTHYEGDGCPGGHFAVVNVEDAFRQLAESRARESALLARATAAEAQVVAMREALQEIAGSLFHQMPFGWTAWDAARAALSPSVSNAVMEAIEKADALARAARNTAGESWEGACQNAVTG